MIRVEPRARRVIWLAVGLLLGAGWAIYGLVGNHGTTFRTVMLVVTLLLGGGTALLVRSRDEQHI